LKMIAPSAAHGGRAREHRTIPPDERRLTVFRHRTGSATGLASRARAEILVRIISALARKGVAASRILIAADSGPALAECSPWGRMPALALGFFVARADGGPLWSDRMPPLGARQRGIQCFGARELAKRRGQNRRQKTRDEEPSQRTRRACVRPKSRCDRLLLAGPYIRLTSISPPRAVGSRRSRSTDLRFLPSIRRGGANTGDFQRSEAELATELKTQAPPICKSRATTWPRQCTGCFEFTSANGRRIRAKSIRARKAAPSRKGASTGRGRVKQCVLRRLRTAQDEPLSSRCRH